jgi:ATP-dependent Clp protease adaptor protein ClpS
LREGKKRWELTAAAGGKHSTLLKLLFPAPGLRKAGNACRVAPLIPLCTVPRNAVSVPVKPGRPRIAPVQPEQEPALEPPYHVILHDDDEHTHLYVVEMLMTIFGYDEAKSFLMACAVDQNGIVIVATVHKELAELRVDQILEYGPDPYAKESKNSMKATMEPAE